MEVCSEKTWISVCDSSWSQNDFSVTCLQAGHTDSGKHMQLFVRTHTQSSILMSLGFAATGFRLLPSLMMTTEVPECLGTEATLLQCFENMTNSSGCQHLEIHCSNPVVVTSSPSPPPPIELETGVPPSGKKKHNSGGSSFPILGVALGVSSALLLVAVAITVGVVVGAKVWKSSKSASSS